MDKHFMVAYFTVLSDTNLGQCMPRALTSKNLPTYLNKLCGGRMTMLRGTAASIAPIKIAAALFTGLSMNVAQAADECGVENLADPADTVTCAAGPYATGIIYANSDGLTLELNNTTISVGSPGVSVNSSAAATGDIRIRGTNVGNVTTTGANESGLFAQILNASSTAKATAVLVAGDIATAGAEAVGVHAQNAGFGVTLAQMDGGMVITTGISRGADGLRSVNGNVLSTSTSTALMTGGNISTMGDDAIGLFAVTSGLGETLAQINNGAITTAGSFGDGLVAFIMNANSTAAATTVMANGGISTTGDDANGLLTATAGLGSTLAQMNGGTIATGGDAANGLFSLIENGANMATATAQLTAGDITTAGDNAFGLFAQNLGLGDTLARMNSGTVSTTGVNGHGLYSWIDNAASMATATALLTAGDVETTENDSANVWAKNTGLGDALAQMDGGSITVAGANTTGLLSTLENAATTATSATLMTAGEIITTGDNAPGFVAGNFGLGLASATVSGASTITASGTNSAGVLTAIFQAAASYAVAVNGTAVVTGSSGSGSGVRTISVVDSSGTIDIAAGATVDGTAGLAGIADDAGNTTMTLNGTLLNGITAGAGNDSANLNAGSVTTGDIAMGDGSDVVMVAAGSDISSVSFLDGGDDLAVADTWIDALTLASQTLSQPGTFLTNWESVVVDGGSLAITDGALSVGSDTGNGLFLSSGGILDQGGLDLNLTGNLINIGITTMQDGTAADSLVVTGNYVGGGSLQLDIQLGDDSSPSDVLSVRGDTDGNTVINVANTTGPGALTTGDGILVVQVDGASNGNFSLGAEVRAGDYLYTLVRVGNDWYLQSTFSLSPPLSAEAIPTLSQWALVLLASLVGGLGLLGSRKQQP